MPPARELAAQVPAMEQPYGLARVALVELREQWARVLGWRMPGGRLAWGGWKHPR